MHELIVWIEEHIAIVVLILVVGCLATCVMGVALSRALTPPSESVIQTVEVPGPTVEVEVPGPVETVEVVITATPAPTATPPQATTTQAAPTAQPTSAPVNADWQLVQVSKYAQNDPPVVINGVVWELPLGTFKAVSIANGRYEAVESAPVGVVNGVDHGWCAPNQIDCPPHGLLDRVEVPQQFISCLKAEMDISWRIQLTNTCGQPVPVRVSIRYNDVTRTSTELMADYLALAGLKQPVSGMASEVGLFVSVRESGLSNLTFGGKTVQYGYSCWDCLADTSGAATPVPVPLVDISTFGTPTAPNGSSLLPGVVFPLPRPGSTAYTLSFDMVVVDRSVVWVGRYDVR